MTVIFNVQGKVFSLEASCLDYSPLLRTMLASELPVSKDGAGHILLNDVSAESFQQYSNFLQGQDFHLTEETAQAFDYLGHSNSLNYPLEVWAMKLRDNWIRDHFYSLELWRNSLYDLMELPKVRNLPIQVPTGWYVAGGAALWLAGYINRLADVDLFTCLPREEANQSLAFLNQLPSEEELAQQQPDFWAEFQRLNRDQDILPYCFDQLTVTGNSISYFQPVPSSKGLVRGGWLAEDYLQHCRETSEEVWASSTPKLSQKVQFILRNYRCPSETVHGFDLDCVGILYLSAEDKLYCTKRTKLALEKQLNWFDPQRASPTYVSRLIKYCQRGFKLYLPLITKVDLNPKAIQHFFDRLDEAYLEEVYGSRWKQTKKKLTKRLERALLNLADQTEQLNTTVSQLLPQLAAELTYPEWSYGQKCAWLRSRNHNFPLDQVSSLLLAAFYDFYPTFNQFRSDYEGYTLFDNWMKAKNIPRDQYPSYVMGQYKRERRQEMASFYQQDKYQLNLQLLPWKAQDPMSQLTSTFHPNPMTEEELKDWYQTSSFLQEKTTDEIHQMLDYITRNISEVLSGGELSSYYRDYETDYSTADEAGYDSLEDVD